MDSPPSQRPKYDPQTDAALWASLCSGKTLTARRAALSQLYERHSGMVYGISLKVLGNVQEAEDLTQDIFIKLVENKKYDSARGSLRTFLMVLTRSRSIDRLRSRQSGQRSQRKLRAEYATSPSGNTDSTVKKILEAEQSTTVKTALSQLSAAQQQALHLTYYEGLTQSDIASRLDTPLTTIKSRTRRGLLKLREILSSCQEKSTPIKSVHGEGDKKS